MDSAGQAHHHYQPGEDCVPVTPQARTLGYPFPVYITKNVWSECVSWPGGRNTSPDRRIYETVSSAYEGMLKRLSVDDQMVQYEFKHWYWSKSRPKAKKPRKITLGARLLIDFETDEPWMLIFDPEFDDDRVVVRGEPKDGEPEEHREDGGALAGEGLRDRAGLDQGPTD